MYYIDATDDEYSRQYLARDSLTCPCEGMTTLYNDPLGRLARAARTSYNVRAVL